MKRVYLEITNSCNLNCPFCTIDKGNNFLSLDQIDNYTNQIKKYCNYLYLHVLGEPLLHPYFEEILNLLDDKGFNLQLVTNGTLLYKYPLLLNHKCLRKLSISIHSVNNIKIEDSYFETIDKLIENNTTNIELRFYDINHLDGKVLSYYNTLKKKYPFIPNDKKNNYRLKDNLYVYTDEYFKWPEINDEYVSNCGNCKGLIDQIAILNNGRVTSCCLDPKGINSFGNLNEDTLENIINSNKFKNSINDLKNRKLTMPLCQHCSYHLRFEHSNS